MELILMPKGENIEKPKKKKGGMVLIIGMGVKPKMKKDDMKKADDPRRKKRGGDRKEKARTYALLDSIKRNPEYLQQRVLKVHNMDVDFLNRYIKEKYNMDIKDVIERKENLPRMINEAARINAQIRGQFQNKDPQSGKLNPKLQEMLDKRGINPRKFAQSFIEKPFISFSDRLNSVSDEDIQSVVDEDDDAKPLYQHENKKGGYPFPEESEYEKLRLLDNDKNEMDFAGNEEENEPTPFEESMREMKRQRDERYGAQEREKPRFSREDVDPPWTQFISPSDKDDYLHDKLTSNEFKNTLRTIAYTQGVDLGDLIESVNEFPQMNIKDHIKYLKRYPRVEDDERQMDDRNLMREPSTVFTEPTQNVRLTSPQEEEQEDSVSIGESGPFRFPFDRKLTSFDNPNVMDIAFAILKKETEEDDEDEENSFMDQCYKCGRMLTPAQAQTHQC